MLTLLFVALGGAAGSISRYALGGWTQTVAGTSFPIGTLVVNLLGCLVIGVLVGLGETHKFLTPHTRALLVVGFLGGFTTFSSFGYETFALLRDGRMAWALSNVGVQVAVGLLAVAAGYTAARAVG